MVAPILGLLLLVLLTLGFVSQSRQQGALIERVATDDLREFNEFTEAFIGLSQAHGALFDLLDDTRGRISEDKLYDRAKTRLDDLRAAVERLRRMVDEHKQRDIEQGSDISPEAALLLSARQYLKAATTAVEITTVDPRLASKQLGRANESFVALSRAFNAFLDRERIELGAEMTVRARRSQLDTVIYGAVALALAVVLLLVSLGSSRLFARSLERQLDALMQLGREAGVQAAGGAGGHEIDRIAAAISMFRAAVMQLRQDERDLTDLNQALKSAHHDLDQRVQDRTRELSTTNAELNREVSAKTRTQQALMRASRSYAALSETNKAILHVTDRQRLFLAVCRIAVEEGGIGAAYVSLIDTSARTVEALIRWGDETLQDVGLAEPRQNAIAGAVLSERPYIANDLALEETLGADCAAIVGAGRSAAWLPLFEGGRAVAVLSLHCAEIGFFDAQVIALFAEMVDNVSFGLDNLERERVRAQTEEALRLRQRAIEASVNAVMIASATRPGFPLEYVNPAYETITGYSAAEVLGRNGAFLQGDDRSQPGVEHLRAALRERREGRALLRNYRKDGRPFWNDLRLAPVRDDSGAVTHIVGVMNDVTETKNYQEQLEHQANHDALTALPNRNLMRDRLEQALAYAQRQDHAVAVAVLDLDHFKLVNDSLGHTAGDELLTTAARRIQSCLRASDTLARLGGDEFVLIMPDCGGHPATAADSPRRMAAEATDVGIADALRRIQTALAVPITVVDRNFHIGCSIGVSIFPQDSRTIEGLLQQADAAMYEAKAQGRGRFHFYSADLNQRINRRIELEAGMRRALEQGEFALHYQPKVDLHTGHVVGAEALLRWNSPDRGPVSPAEFIPLAEETGLIVPIGDWVLRAACAQMELWRAAGLPALTVAVNLSPRQLHSAALVDHVSTLLDQHGLPPSSLELEITETAMVENPDRTRDLLREVSARGIRLAIDDFGTGYSSLAYLKRFRANTLKIDRAFVRDIAVDAGDAAMTSAIIGMAKDLGMRTVAEGVETDAQMQRLRTLGCDEMQGFLFSPALPPEQFARLIKDRRRLDLSRRPADEIARTVLLVDDESNVISALKRELRKDSYTILTATSAREGLELLARNRVDVVVSDQRMPEMTGTEFLVQVKSMYPDTVRIVLSGYTDLASITDAINRGAVYKFLTKPWEGDELRRVVRDAFRQHARKATALVE